MTGWPEFADNTIREAKARGESNYAIAARLAKLGLHKSVCAIASRAARLGLHRRDLQWPSEADALLRERIDARDSGSAIAAALLAAGFPKSRNAVLGRASRLGLRLDGAPNRSRTPRERRVRKPRPKRRPAVLARPASSVEALEPVWMARDGCFDALPEGGVDILGLTADLCHWPHGDEKNLAEFRYCGAPVARAPWCAGHAALAYRAE